MPVRLRKAVPHANMHTEEYYNWINQEVKNNTVKDTKTLDLKLVSITFRLLTNTVKPNIWSAGKK